MKKPLTILFVSEPAVDGVFRHVAGLAEFAIAAGHQVHVAYSDRRSCSQLPAFLEKVRTNGGETLNLAVSNFPQPGDLTALFNLRKLVARVRPDIIHANSTKAGMLTRLLMFTGIRVPILYSPHAYYGMGRNRSAKTAFVNLIESALGRVGKTLSISTDESNFAKSVLRIPQNRIEIIFNGVNTNKFSSASAEKKKELRAQFGLPPDALVLGSMGRLSYQKDPVTLYRALKMICSDYPNLYLLHVGRGELAPELELLANDLGISDRIIRKEYLEDPTLFFPTLDAFILTSRYEGFALVMLEALSADLPLIVSRCPGTHDLFQAGLSHLWSAPVGEPSEFSLRIGDWIKDRELNRISNHRKIALNTFSDEACYRRSISLYQQMLPEQRSAQINDIQESPLSIETKRQH
jgi:glycosyltransferase involved in cell wall biosynthesis